MSKKKMKYIDTQKVNDLSITQVAEDWGIELHQKWGGSYDIYCPNPHHQDNSLGNCVLTENSDKNMFFCFACHAGGGPINLVMHLDSLDFGPAKEKLAKRYGLFESRWVDPDIPIWEGLNAKEYSSLGMRNARIKSHRINEEGKLVEETQRFTLRDLAAEDPAAHDDILIGKFLEKIEGLIQLRMLLEKEALLAQDKNLFWQDSWQTAIENIAEEEKELLFKGLMNKERYDQVVMSYGDRIMLKAKKEAIKKIKEAETA